MKSRLLFSLLLSFGLAGPASADLFMVKTNEGPGFRSPQEAAEVLEKGIMPLFEQLLALQKNNRIVAGGLPLGSRKFYMIVEADSHDQVDRMLRELPGWGVFSWKVIPLQTIKGRSDMERETLKSLKSEN